MSCAAIRSSVAGMIFEDTTKANMLPKRRNFGARPWNASAVICLEVALSPGRISFMIMSGKFMLLGYDYGKFEGSKVEEVLELYYV